MSLKLTSNDGQSFQLNSKSIQRSKYLVSQLDSGKSEVKFEEIKGDILKEVVAYLEHYANEEPKKIPEVLKSNNLAKELESEWDVNFISAQSFENTFHLINAAVFLELDHLHDLACARIASFMKDKSPEDVNKEFTIECQLTAEEAKELGLEVGEEAA